MPYALSMHRGQKSEIETTPAQVVFSQELLDFSIDELGETDPDTFWTELYRSLLSEDEMLTVEAMGSHLTDVVVRPADVDHDAQEITVAMVGYWVNQQSHDVLQGTECVVTLTAEGVMRNEMGADGAYDKEFTGHISRMIGSMAIDCASLIE